MSVNILPFSLDRTLSEVWRISSLDDLDDLFNIFIIYRINQPGTRKISCSCSL